MYSTCEKYQLMSLKSHLMKGEISETPGYYLLSSTCFSYWTATMEHYLEGFSQIALSNYLLSFSLFFYWTIKLWGCKETYNGYQIVMGQIQHMYTHSIYIWEFIINQDNCFDKSSINPPWVGHLTTGIGTSEVLQCGFSFSRKRSSQTVEIYIIYIDQK